MGENQKVRSPSGRVAAAAYLILAMALAAPLFPLAAAVDPEGNDAQSGADAPDIPELALLITPGIVEGRLHPFYDFVDFYRIILDKGQLMSIDVSAERDAARVDIKSGRAWYAYATPGMPIEFIAPATGEYLIPVIAQDAEDAPISYVMHVDVKTRPFLLMNSEPVQVIEARWDEPRELVVFAAHWLNQTTGSQVAAAVIEWNITLSDGTVETGWSGTVSGSTGMGETTRVETPALSTPGIITPTRVSFGELGYGFGSFEVVKRDTLSGSVRLTSYQSTSHAWNILALSLSDAFESGTDRGTPDDVIVRDRQEAQGGTRIVTPILATTPPASFQFEPSPRFVAFYAPGDDAPARMTTPGGLSKIVPFAFLLHPEPGTWTIERFDTTISGTTRTADPEFSAARTPVLHIARIPTFQTLEW